MLALFLIKWSTFLFFKQHGCFALFNSPEFSMPWARPCTFARHFSEIIFRRRLVWQFFTLGWDCPSSKLRKIINRAFSCTMSSILCKIVLHMNFLWSWFFFFFFFNCVSFLFLWLHDSGFYFNSMSYYFTSRFLKFMTFHRRCQRLLETR